MPDSPWIRSTTDATFQQDVLDASRERPVVVDFWASWCQPCMALKPVLEKLAIEYDGKFVLVKAETEHNQAAAAQFNVGGIPAVYGVSGGELVDEFAGLIPEPQLRTWLERVIAAGQLVAVERLEGTDPAAAESQYRELIAKFPRETSLAIGLGRTLLAQQKHDEARAMIAKLEERGFLEPAAQKLKAQLDLVPSGSSNLGELERLAAASPNDLAAQLELAKALARAERHEDALQRCLQIIAAQKTGAGEQAKQLMLDIFRILPGDSDLTSVYRRKLASLLY